MRRKFNSPDLLLRWFPNPVAKAPCAASSQPAHQHLLVETYRAEMNRLASMLPEYPMVMGLYGVGESFGPQLMAEIGDVRRFDRKQARCLYGIDPMPNQSGEKNEKQQILKERLPISAQNPVQYYDVPAPVRPG